MKLIVALPFMHLVNDFFVCFKQSSVELEGNRKPVWQKFKLLWIASATLTLFRIVCEYRDQSAVTGVRDATD